MSTTSLAESIYSNLPSPCAERLISYVSRDGTVFSQEDSAELYDQIYCAHSDIFGDEPSEQKTLFFKVLKLIIEGE